MKTIFPVLYTFALAAGLVSCGKHTQKISIFSDHIGVIAQQEGISFADAAAKVKSLGYDAADVWTFSDDKTLKTLDSLGFEHSCAIGYINFFDDGRSIPFGRDLQQNTEDLCLDFCARHGYKNLMIVPWGRGNSTLPDAEVLQRMSSFISRANAQGVDVLFEDNDQMTAYVHSGADLEKVFDAIPSAGHSDYFVEMEPESSIEEADQRAGFMYNLSEIMARRPDVLQQAPPAPAEPVDPALVLDKSLKDIAQSCSFILSAPYVK